MNNSVTKFLNEIKVLDLSGHYSGDLTSMFLSDFGALVFKYINKFDNTNYSENDFWNRNKNIIHIDFDNELFYKRIKSDDFKPEFEDFWSYVIQEFLRRDTLPKLFDKKLFPKKECVHFCDMCGPFVKGYSELWEKGASGPFKIEFFQYHEGLKVKVDEVNISNHETNKPVLLFDFCGLCNGLIKNKFLTKDKVMKIMREHRSHLV